MYKYAFVFLSLFLLVWCTNSAPGVSPESPTTQAPISATIPSPTFGEGKHTLTIFADFQCPACIAFDRSIAPIFEEYAQKGLLKITYKQFPLVSIHRNAEWDAVAALCGAEQDRYMPYKKALYMMEERKNGASVSDEDRVLAWNNILDTKKLAECIKEKRYLDQVRSEMKEAQTLGVNGTPSVFFDGKKLDNSVFRDLAALRTVMNRLLETPTPSTSPSTPTPSGTGTPE